MVRDFAVQTCNFLYLELLLQLICQIVGQYEHRTNSLREYIEADEETKSSTRMNENELKSLQNHIEDLKKSLQGSENRVIELKEKNLIDTNELTQQINNLNTVNNTLKQRITQWNQKFKTKEQDYEALRLRLNSLVEKVRKGFFQSALISSSRSKRK